MKLKKNKLIILGAGGNATVILSSIEDINDRSSAYEILGYLDDAKEKGMEINNYKVLGPISDAGSYLKYSDVQYVYSLLTANKMVERVEKLNKLQIPVERFATLIHPSATVSRNSILKHGVLIMPGVVVSPNVLIGNFVNIYANSLIGHDAVIEDYCFIANCASIGSTVRLKKCSYVGSNATILEKVVVGEYALLGLGAVVLKDVPPRCKVVGNPARILP